MANRKYSTSRKTYERKQKSVAKICKGQAKAAFLQIFQMRKKSQGRGREQDRTRNKHAKSDPILFSRPGLFAFKESGLAAIWVVLG